MKLFNYSINKEDVESFGWFYILPSIEIQHKYWYLYRIAFSWLKWNLTISFIHKNWNMYK